MPQPQRLPNFVQGYRKQRRTKPSSPKILHASKTLPHEAMGHGDFRDGDSSIDDNESVLFDEFEDASSVTTDDSLFDEHDKYVPQSEVVGRLQRTASRGHRTDPLYRLHHRPENRYLRYNEHHRPEQAHYPYGEVDIYPENSMFKRRHDRRLHSAPVSHLVVSPRAHPTSNNRRDRHGVPPSPHSTHTLPPPTRYANTHIRYDIGHDKNWERAKHERERSLGDYVRDKRRREQESHRRRWDQGVQVHTHHAQPKVTADHHTTPLPREDRFDKYARMADLNQMDGSGPPYHQHQDKLVDDAFNDPDPFGRERANPAPMGFGPIDSERMASRHHPQMEEPRQIHYATYRR